MSINIEMLKLAIKDGAIEWQRHSLERMFQRGISREHVIQTILDGEQIESYPVDKPFPSGLFLKLFGNQPIHTVVAFNSVEKKAFIITAYEAGLDYFESDFKTRRKP